MTYSKTDRSRFLFGGQKIHQKNFVDLDFFLKIYNIKKTNLLRKHSIGILREEVFQLAVI